MAEGKAMRGVFVGLCGSLLLLAGLTEAQTEPSLEERVARLERMLGAGGLLDLVNRLDQLQEQMQRLQGQLDVQAHAVDQIRERQRQLAVAPERRAPAELQAFGPAESPAAQPRPPAGGPPPGPPMPAAALPPAPPAPAAAEPSGTPSPPAAPAATALSEQDAYERALGLLRDRRYDEAGAALRTYLQDYPKGEYAANAAYWLGEVYYVGGKPDEALAAFRKVVDDYPQASKVPDAMLKLGLIQADQGRQAEARQMLERVVRDYPETTAARLAQDRLQKLGVGPG
jgi:tol-pal system protein YbgF